MRRARWVAAGVTLGMITAVLSLGCSSMSDGGEELDYTPTVKSVDDGRGETRDLSSSLLNLVGIDGEVTEHSPGVSTCDVDPDMEENLYVMRDPWSIYGVPVETLEEGMNNLRRELPRNGWEIVEEGELNNAERSPRILFENHELEFAVNVTIEGTSDGNPHLALNVVSACFKTPEGESPQGEY